MIFARARPVGARRSALWLAALLAAAPGAASAESLGDAIALAYQTNPTLLAARADLRALDERYVQSRAAMGPSASVSEQHSFDDAYVQQPASLFGPATTAHDRSSTDTAQLVVNQPLFAGGQLSTASQAAQADVLAGRQALRQQETVVLNAVITGYADVLLARDLVTIAQQNVRALDQQLAETQAKVDAKENTLTDRAQARARLAAAQISLVQARSGVRDAEARYVAAIGEPPGDLDPLPDLPGLPPSVDAALDAADQANPEIQQAIYTELASRARVAQAKSADGLQVNLSVSLSQQPAAPYISNQNAQGVTASVVVSKPLFASGGYVSRVREAAETDNRDDLKVTAEQRQVIATVAQNWSDLAARRETLSGLRGQLADEEQAFRGSRIEERIGLRTTIDVLNAEQEFQSTKVALLQGYHDEYLNRVGLLAAIGVLQGELLEPDIEAYRPEDSLRKRNMLAKALPWEDLVAALDSLGTPHVAPERSARDVLGLERPVDGPPMPAAPSWSDLTQYLADDPTAG